MMRRAAIILVLIFTGVAQGARGFDGANDYFVMTTAGPISAYPFSVSAWFYVDATASVTPAIFTMNDQDVTDKYYVIDAYVTPATSRARARNTSDHVAATTNTWTTGTWHQITGVFPDNADVRVYLDGDLVNYGLYDGAAGAHPWITVIDRLSIGVSVRSGGNVAYWKGSIAEVGLWDVALSTADVTNLSTNKYAPGLVQASHLKAWWKLAEGNAADNAVDEEGSYTLTATHSPAVTSHPSGIKYSLPGAPKHHGGLLGGNFRRRS